MRRFSVIIPAAGRGLRTGADVPKQFAEINNRSVLAHSAGAFLAFEECAELVVAVEAIRREYAVSIIGDDERVRFVDGGSTRQSSIANALAALTGSSSIVLVHDAARPCVRGDLIGRVVDAAFEFGAAVPVVALADTIKRVNENGVVIATIARDQLRAAQTPQGFRRDLLEHAYAHAQANNIDGTDDAFLVEAFGIGVYTVDGDHDNVKITVADDFERAAIILRMHAADARRR